MQTEFIYTQRLILRTWQDAYLEPFAAMNQDPLVMACFPNLLSKNETTAMVQKINTYMDQHGFGLFACILKETQEFIGFVGLSAPSFVAHFTPCIEIGWRLAKKYWDKGYATEAARAVLKAGFEQYGLNEIFSFTTLVNQRSRHVMEKLGMQHDVTDDFNHPKLAESHPLSKHVLYRISKERWLTAQPLDRNMYQV